MKRGAGSAYMRAFFGDAQQATTEARMRGPLGPGARAEQKWKIGSVRAAVSGLEESGCDRSSLVWSSADPPDQPDMDLLSMAGLLARGSGRSLAFPACSASGLMRLRLRLQLRGQRRTGNRSPTGFPIIPSRGPWTGGEW